jgi:hypothetical protein
MRSVETIPGVGGGRIKENNGGSEFNYDIYKFHKVPPIQQ